MPLEDPLGNYFVVCSWVEFMGINLKRLSTFITDFEVNKYPNKIAISSNVYFRTSN